MRYLLLILCLWPGITFAKCAVPQDFGDETALLLTKLLTAQDETTASIAAAGLWKVWLTAPDQQAQDMLDYAMSRREAYDFEHAETLLDDLVAYCPGYPEAYNQRAFARFLRDNYEGALEDLDVVLDTVPYHFGALSGRAMSLMGQGRAALAQETLRRAVKVHPFLRERHMIQPETDKKL